MMKKPVVAIGLDAADPELVEAWMAEGHLPVLSALRERGGYGRLSNLEYYKAETPWTIFLTGCMPERLGYWTPIKFFEGTYDTAEIEAYDFRDYPPFYALGEDFRVAVFDVPQTALSDDVSGPQVLAWGAHSPQTPSHSKPESLLRELQRQYGEHPALHRDHGSWWDEGYLKFLHKAMRTGIERRIPICRDWLRKERWDLFLTIFGEPHSAGHDFWFLSQKDNPLYGKTRVGAAFKEDPMLDVFKEVDRAVGAILEAAPDDAHIVVFSVHGSGNNVTDVASMLLLPEFLYRFSFPGKAMLAKGQPGAALPPPGADIPRSKSWRAEMWSRYRHEQNPVKRFLRRNLPRRFHRMVDRLPPRNGPALVSPEALKRQKQGVSWQPTMWYRDLWPGMKAFALPSFSEGYVRINLKGREPDGIVPADRYEALCDELTSEIMRLTNPRSGKPVAKKVRRTRKSAADRDPKLPDADLIVIWDEEPADVVDHPTLGRIGPVPYRRTGSHRNRGFWIATGPQIAPGSSFEPAHAVDLPATILALMGAAVPAYMDGKPLLSPAQAAQNREAAS
jgi:predicted AlkP superfamily phosphohydrolase/phosphomutase